MAIPPVETNKVGISLDHPTVVPSYVDFENVYVATTADNAQIAQGNHIILTPGIYQLTDTINVNQQGLVVLGIGFPTLISNTGKPCIVVSGQNVRMGGVLLQAGSSVAPVTPALLLWGTTSTDGQNGFLYDCFARTGRFQNYLGELLNQATLMVHIISNHVVCDNLWLWRADHDSLGLVKDRDNYCTTAFFATAIISLLMDSPQNIHAEISLFGMGTMGSVIFTKPNSRTMHRLDLMQLDTELALLLQATKLGELNL